eukprot:IDg22203t1
MGALVCTESWMSSVCACWGWASLGACAEARFRRDAAGLWRVCRVSILDGLPEPVVSVATASACVRLCALRAGATGGSGGGAASASK